MSDVRQPMPRPRTMAEYVAARSQMIDTHGEPLRLAHCASCAREHFIVEPCAAEAACPRCASTSSRCRRPSGHEADAWHVERAAAFEQLCAAREAAGLPRSPAGPRTPRRCSPGPQDEKRPPRPAADGAAAG